VKTLGKGIQVLLLPAVASAGGIKFKEAETESRSMSVAPAGPEGMPLQKSHK
jgi:hypothetical protein